MLHSNIWFIFKSSVILQARLIVENIHLHILPSMNPDGYFLRSRGNANNIDLNRDFPDQVLHCCHWFCYFLWGKSRYNLKSIYYTLLWWGWILQCVTTMCNMLQFCSAWFYLMTQVASLTEKKPLESLNRFTMSKEF
jgi:hypothetical protein